MGQMSPTDDSSTDFFSSIYLPFLHFVRVPIFRICETTRLAPVLDCDTIFSLFSCYEQQPVVFLLRHSILNSLSSLFIL